MDPSYTDTYHGHAFPNTQQNGCQHVTSHCHIPHSKKAFHSTHHTAVHVSKKAQPCLNYDSADRNMSPFVYNFRFHHKFAHISSMQRTTQRSRKGSTTFAQTPLTNCKEASAGTAEAMVAESLSASAVAALPSAIMEGGAELYATSEICLTAAPVKREAGEKRTSRASCWI